MSAAALTDAIDALLPQTQCTKCGFQGCRPYAQAIAGGEAEINRCPPGGSALIARLARLLAREPVPLDPACGKEQPRTAAFIREEWCIGCALCIQACPVDAIVGSPKQLHTVLTAQCTGCELCVAPCPVDCIELLPLSLLAAHGSAAAQAQLNVPVAQHAQRWRARYHARNERLARERAQRDERLADKAREQLERLGDDPGAARKRAAIEAALQRARARRESAQRNCTE
jgi:electron transport complex protein RnfB